MMGDEISIRGRMKIQLTTNHALGKRLSYCVGGVFRVVTGTAFAGDQRYAHVLPVCLSASTRGLGSTHVHQLFGFKLQVFESRIDA